MIKYIIATCILGSLFFACKNKNNTTIQPTITTDTTKPFPIAELLQAQFNDVLQTPYFMYIITKKGNKQLRDSVIININKFNELIEPLLKIDLGTKQFKTKFKETAFDDLSTQSITIITTALDKNLSFKNVTTLLNNETNSLKSMFFVFNNTNGDTTFTTNYYLKANKSLTINTIKQFKKEPSTAVSQFVNWNDK